MDKWRIGFMIFTVLMTINCSTTKKIQRNMSIASQKLVYASDTVIKSSQTDIKIYIDSVILNSNINKSITVENTGGYYLPLLVFHKWKLKKDCKIGKDNIESDISNFVKESIQNELMQKGFVISQSDENFDYKLSLRIDSLVAKGQYINKGFHFYIITGYAYGYNDLAGPAVAKLNIAYKLSDGVNEFLSNTIITNTETQILSSKEYGNIKVLQQEYVISMVNAISCIINEALEKIANEINEKL